MASTAGVLRRATKPMDVPAFECHISYLLQDFYLWQDFHIDVDPRKTGDAYRQSTSRLLSAKMITSATRPSTSQPRSAGKPPISPTAVD
jgi:hypothetical protein